MNLGETDKGIGDTISALSGAVEKKVGDADKGAWGVGKRVSDKATHFLNRDI